MTALTDTATRQLPTLPRVPEYCRATPGEDLPSLANPVSSMTQARGRISSTALAARARRTGSTGQNEEETNRCSCW